MELTGLGVEHAAAVFDESPAQREIRRAVRGLLERAAGDGGAALDAAELERRLAGELGACGVLVPERWGGAGLGFAEAVAILEEMGRALYGGPYLGSAILAVDLVALLGGAEQCGDLLAAVAAGERVAAVALAEDDGRWEPGAVAATAAPDGGRWRLHGCKSFVLDGVRADALLVVAHAPDGLGAFLLDGDAPGLARRPLPTLDPSRPLARIELDGAPADRVGAAAEEAVRRWLPRACVALAAEQVGVAQACLDAAVDYAQQRTQFGRPIGSFQAIQQKCADMLLGLADARAAARYAAWAAATGSPELPRAAALAKAVACDAAFAAAGESLQIHGGIGFTAEHPAHRYLKRAKSAQLLFGGSDRQYELLADLVGL